MTGPGRTPRVSELMNIHRAALSPACWSAALALGLGAATVASVPAATAAGPGREVMLHFNDTNTLERQSGITGATVRTVTADGGSTRHVAGPAGGGQAVRLPAYSSGTSPKAAFSVVDTDGADDLEPGSASFVFGADFAIDQVSTGSSQDDGNNLVQRGLYNDAAQMKIQVDGARPSCRLKGSSGEVHMKSPVVVTPGTWYRTTCARAGSTLTFRLVRLSDRATWTRTVTRSLGTFSYATSTPFSSGGKLASPTRFTGGSSDQFNGVVDRVFLDVT